MKIRIVQIGNSRGVRIPKPMLEAAGLQDEVELLQTDEGLVLRPIKEPRAGWAEAALLVRERGEDGLLDPPSPTRFDAAEWEWGQEERE